MKTTQIYQTKDYSKFQVDDSNRSINKPGLKRMVESLKETGWLAAYPMHVVSKNNSLVIIDGQHRFAAAKQLGLPVFYVVSGDPDTISIASINVAMTRWNGSDFATSHANQGKPYYAALLEFSAKHKLSLGISAKLLMGVGGRGVATHEIREGKFRISNFENATMVAGIVTAIKKRVAWASNASFVAALMRACHVKGFSPTQFLKRCETNPGMLVLQPTLESFLSMIEEIYNYRSLKRDKLSIKYEATHKSK